MKCDKCKLDIDEKWIHFIQDNTFTNYPEDSNPCYTFCNRCWEAMTDRLNLKVENALKNSGDLGSLNEEHKDSLYPYGPQPITSSIEPK